MKNMLTHPPKKEKIQRLASQVGRFNAIITICVNLTLICTLWLVLDNELEQSEERYMAEVISRVSLEINGVLDNYITFAQGIAQSYILNQFLTAVQVDTVPGHDEVFDAGEVEGFQSAINELKIAKEMFGDTVETVTVCSVYKDNFLTHLGERGDETFSLSTVPFYEAVNTGKTYISDPYQGMLSGSMVVAIAAPMFDTNGQVYGLFAIEIATEQLANILSSSAFGETGNTYIVDRNQNILVYPGAVPVGTPISSLNFEGGFLSELQNPTGQIVQYTRDGIPRVGGITKISDLTGWTVIAALNASEFDSSIQRVIRALVIAMIFGMITTTIFCARNLIVKLSPLQGVETTMDELAKGNLSARVDYRGSNEIGRLATTMNQMAETLSSYIKKVDATMGNFGRGNFSIDEKLDFQGDFYSIQRSMEDFLTLMTRSLKNLDHSIQEVTIGANQMSTGAQTLSNGSSEQASSVVELNSLIGRINTTIQETAANSSSVTTDAENISDNLVKSNLKMQELAVSVKDIRVMSDEVKRIIKTIEDVAFQTNILSLNASVEAARAGTAGRGFAVVADQARILSAQTAEAADETNKIINNIATAIETGSELAEFTSKNLQEVVDDVAIFVEKISGISLSAQGQADDITEINRGILLISEVVQQNSAISQESAAASEELSTQSQLMMDMVRQFKLK